MFNRIDASKSTKGASKLRRDLINAEIANLRDLLPLPPSTRQRLSQLQLMALVCVFLRKANYFQHVLKNDQEAATMPTPNIGFSKAMSGFIMMMTQQGKLLYISENAAEYLGHSMEDLLIHGDSVYDVVDKQDHMVIQNQLARSGPGAPDDRRLFLCRINVSRNSRRQLRFGDQKVVLVEGHYLPFVPLCNRNESVFLASCTPVVLPETRESVVQGATNIFTTIHSMDMKYLHIDKTAESHMEYSRSELVGVSWYNLLHWDSIRTAYCKHQTVIQSDQERSSTALLRLQSRSGRWFWVHCVLQVKDTSEECQHPIIVCTNQVLSEKEAEVMRASSWLYQYSSQTKFTYGVCPTIPGAQGPQPQAPPQPVTVAPPPVLPPPQPQPLAYEVPTVDYNRAYGIPPHELELGVPYQQPPTHHPLDDGHMAVWAKERPLVKQEPTEVYGGGAANDSVVVQRCATRGHGQEADAAEPVDMSINNSGPEHDEQHRQQHHHQMQQHCPNVGSAEFCPCNKAHLPMVHHNNNKSPNRTLTPSGLSYLRPSSKSSSSSMSHHYMQQLSPQQPPTPHLMSPPSPSDNGCPKYNIVDLDKLQGHVSGLVDSGDLYGPTYSQKRQLLLLHHQTKAATQQPGLMESHGCIAEGPHHHLALHPTEQWTSPSATAIPSPALWPTTPDCGGLQRVPDVVHQELSPYITTPTTPAEPPDSIGGGGGGGDTSDHRTPETPVSVFNFDWPVAAEQHVPNLRVLSFRSSSAGYVDSRRDIGHQPPITLQLPRKKNLHTESPQGHRDYAK